MLYSLWGKWLPLLASLPVMDCHWSSIEPLLLAQLVPRLNGNNMWLIRSEWMEASRALDAPTLLHLHPTSSHASPKTSSVLCILYFYLRLLFLISLFLICVNCNGYISVEMSCGTCCCKSGGDTFHTWPILYFENSFFFPPLWLHSNHLILKMCWWSGEHRTVVSLFFLFINMKIFSLKLYSQSWFIAFLK